MDSSRVELLAHIGQSTGHDVLAERITVDVHAIIDQADEARASASAAVRTKD